MNKETFVDRTMRHFSFLETEYDFKVILASSSEVRPQTDGVVKYASNTILVVIDSDMGQAAMGFGRIQDDERNCLDPISIHEYLNTSESEKQVLLSIEPSNQLVASRIRTERSLSSTPAWRGTGGDIYQDLETRLGNFANWLKENADLCLSGDLSRWPALYEYKINRMMADELRRGGKSVVKAVVKDEGGKLKTIERPIFQREKEHLAKLKREILGQ
jgi:hypothetical protein